MPRTIHRNGDKYREWCSVDGYVTPLLTLAEMERHLIRCHATPRHARRCSRADRPRRRHRRHERRQEVTTQSIHETVAAYCARNLGCDVEDVPEALKRVLSERDKYKASLDAIVTAVEEERDTRAVVDRYASDVRVSVAAEVRHGIRVEAHAAAVARLDALIADAPQPDGFYLFSAAHSRGDILLWWRPDARGYTVRLDDAGIYTAERAKVHCEPSDGDTVAVPVAVAVRESARVVLDSARKRVLDGAMGGGK